MYLTIAQVCARLNVSRWTVHRRIKSGELEAIKDGNGNRFVRISEESLARYIERHQTGGHE